MVKKEETRSYSMYVNHIFKTLSFYLGKNLVLRWSSSRTIWSSYLKEKNGKSISGICDKSEGKRCEGEETRKILENLETCVRHTLYPRFCTCISCTVIVVRPSVLASLFVTAFLIRSRAKYPERNRYLKRRRMYLLLGWLIDKVHLNE